MTWLHRSAFFLSLLLVGLLAVSPEAKARKLVVKMGTVAPQGSIWHKALLQMADVFQEETNGKVTLKVYAAVVGDEATIVRKMRVGQLHAATLTNTGLALITAEPMAVQLPMQFEDEAEMDAVMDHMTPLFDKALEDDGFVTLTWSDGGWVHFFTKKPAVALDDVQGLKMWMWAHDSAALKSFSAIGFSPVVLSGVDIIPSLQTGMIESLPTTAMSALAIQSYPLTPNMIDIKWGSMVGGTIISKKIWDKIPADARPKIRSRCMAIGKQLSENVRRETAAAIESMKSKGLKVHKPSPAQMQQWRERAKKSLAIVRGNSVDAALADKALEFGKAYRAKRGSK